jgi:2-dehydropantoate 2-reductase
MRYIIFGAGAIGGAIAARLAQHGHDVVAIARGGMLDAMRERGLMLQTPDETLTQRIAVAAHPLEIAFREGDVVLMTMKTQDSERALDDLRAAAGDGVPVVCAQNGVENERLALRRFARVYGMLVILPATYIEPGVLQAHSAPVTGILDAGRYPSGTDALIEHVTTTLEASGFSAHATPEIMRWKYAKLISNLANVLQAACGLDGHARDVLTQLQDEAVACYRAAGIDWASDEEMRARRQPMRLRPVGGAARAGGSSWQSIARGAGSIETDFLNGEIALLGRQHGVPAPANAAMQAIGRRLVRERLPAGSLSLDDVRAAISAAASLTAETG